MFVQVVLGTFNQAKYRVDPRLNSLKTTICPLKGQTSKYKPSIMTTSTYLCTSSHGSLID